MNRDEIGAMTEKQISEIYSQANNAGLGFAVGGEKDGLRWPSKNGLRNAAKADEFVVWHSVGVAGSDDELLLMSNDIGENFILGWAHGPWAVPVE